MGSGYSRARGAASLGMGVLLGIFISAFVSMVATSAGSVIGNEWLWFIGLAVMIVGVFPIHRLVWSRASRRPAADAPEVGSLAVDRGTEIDR